MPISGRIPGSPLTSVSKEDVPPRLPETLRRRWFRGRRPRLRLRFPCAHDDDGMLAGADVSQLLARFFLDHRGVLVVFGLLRQLIVIRLCLLYLLLGSIKALH